MQCHKLVKNLLFEFSDVWLFGFALARVFPRNDKILKGNNLIVEAIVGFHKCLGSSKAIPTKRPLLLRLLLPFKLLLTLLPTNNKRRE